MFRCYTIIAIPQKTKLKIVNINKSAFTPIVTPRIFNEMFYLIIGIFLCVNRYILNIRVI